MRLSTFRSGTTFKDKKNGKVYKVKSISLYEVNAVNYSSRADDVKVVHAKPLAGGKTLNVPYELLQDLERSGRIEVI